MDFITFNNDHIHEITFTDGYRFSKYINTLNCNASKNEYILLFHFSVNV